jgi:transcriptional regulator with XRE-family HTH domain
MSKLKSYRTRKGWTLDEAAAELGLSKSYISELETGARPWTLKAARKVEAATGGAIRAADLLGFSQPKRREAGATA